MAKSQSLDLYKEVWSAVCYNNSERLKQLMDSSAGTSIINLKQEDKTLLHTAALNGDIECTRILLNHGADINVETSSGLTVLHLAACCPTSQESTTKSHTKLFNLNKRKKESKKLKQLELVKLLLSHGANPISKSQHGETPELLATENDHHEVAKLLKEEGEKHRQRQRDKEYKLNFVKLREACMEGNVQSFIAVLSNEPRALNDRCPHTGQSLLYTAAAYGKYDLVKFIIEKGGHDIPDTCNPTKAITPLQVACQKGFLNIVKLLMEKQPRYIKYYDAEQRSPLHDACKRGHYEIVYYLLSCASIDKTFSANNDFLESIQTQDLLANVSPTTIAKYVDPRNTDKNERKTPLHDAAERGHLKVVKLLLRFMERGTVADIDPSLSNSFNSNKNSPLDPPEPMQLAPRNSLKRSDKYVSSARSIAGIDTPCRVGYTPFHLAALNNNILVCHELLAAGAQVNAYIRPELNTGPNEVDFTLLVEAANSDDKELLRFLLRQGASDDRNRALRRTLRFNFNEASGLLLSYSPGVKLTTIDQESEYHTTEKETHLLDICWQHKELDRLQQEWLHTVLKECIQPMMSSVIIKLDVSRNKLSSLPFQLFQINTLIDFDCSNNIIAELPSYPEKSQHGHRPLGHSFSSPLLSPSQASSDQVKWYCDRLKKLNIAHNTLTTIPDYVFEFPKLEELRANNNNISNLPVSMWSAYQLSIIVLDHNNLSQLPYPDALKVNEHQECILEQSVYGDKILLSPSIKDSPTSSRNSLDYSNLNPQNTPITFNSFSSSNSFIHDNLHLASSRSNNIQSKTNLWVSTQANATIDTSANKSQATSAIKGTLRKVHMRKQASKKSSLENPDGSEIDVPPKKRTSNESCLTSLSVCHNKLHSLPPAMACYAPSLKKLYLSHNLLKELGEVNNFPPFLEIIDVSYNSLTQSILPNMNYGAYKGRACYSSKPQTLTVLEDHDLMCPHRIHKTLRKLSTLKFAKNQLTSVQLFRPPLKQNLSGLEKSADQGVDIGGSDPTSGSHHLLQGAQNVHKNSHGSGSSGNSSVHSNPMGFRTSKDSAYLSQSMPRDHTRDNSEVAPPLYPELSSLDISHNKIDRLPKDIHLISTLGSLNISYNELIEKIPLQLCRLDNLFQLDYSGLELSEPSSADLDKYHRTIDKLNYMRDLLESSEKNYKMKLMLVGLQKQGKTSLLNRLREVSEKVPSAQTTWGERTSIMMSGQPISDNKKTSLSTVGVDLGEWRYSKDFLDPGQFKAIGRRGAPKNNPVITFYTWDFAGQEEYYATHQCFLTYRSLYLLLWSASRGKEGCKELAFWLHNIQSRAPGSPVIIIGTHLDKLGATQEERNEVKHKLELNIRNLYRVEAPIQELEEHGLPVIKDVLFVSMPSSGRNEGINDLRRTIYDIAMSLQPMDRRRHNKSLGQTLLDQPVPQKYIKLENRIHEIRHRLRSEELTPVLSSEEFRNKTQDIAADPVDLQQAVTYLHENGVLLHYNTPTLEHMYFVDPQWLVDMLAHIITVPEVNRYIKRNCGSTSGILRKDFLSQIFKGHVFASTFQREYIELLGRFEVALALNSELLLIPSFLPECPLYTIHWYKTTFPRPQISTLVKEYLSDGFLLANINENNGCTSREYSPNLEHSIRTDSLEVGNTDSFAGNMKNEPRLSVLSTRTDLNKAQIIYTGLLLRRFYFMLYMPSGFWPRLISRLMSNSSILDIIREMIGTDLDDSSEEPKNKVQMDNNENSLSFMTAIGHSKLHWSYWKTGVELWIEDKCILRVSEIKGSDFYKNCSNKPHLVSEETGDKSRKETQNFEMINPNIHSTHFVEGVGPIDPFHDTNKTLFSFNDHYNLITSLHRTGLEILIPDAICLTNIREENQNGFWPSAKLLAKVVDFIDSLLEDWFPGLGARNILPDEGLPKVIRLVLCPLCVGMGQGVNNGGLKAQPSVSKKKPRGARIGRNDKLMASLFDTTINFNSCAFLVEDLLYNSKLSTSIGCLNHKDIPIRDIAPDLVFSDLSHLVLDPECVDRERYIDAGAFGEIYYGLLYRTPTGSKMTTGDLGEHVAIKVQVSKEGKVDPKHIIMCGYLSMRAELNILEVLNHPNIIKVLGILLDPYSLLVEWAPQGSLNSIMRNFLENNLSLQPHVLQKTVMQVADGLAYLHKKEIIYYDLKSPNILAFEFPTVQMLRSNLSSRLSVMEHEMPTSRQINYNDDENLPIVVKVADMGISRYSVLGKTKGFRGTPGFMAPEIIRFHGTETCDCKVDIFSMGMFMYELISGHFPYEFQNLMDGQIEKLIVNGERPTLQKREVTNPLYFLNIMQWCWADNPKDRPTAEELSAVIRNGSVPRLIDAYPLGFAFQVSATCVCEIGGPVETIAPNFPIGNTLEVDSLGLERKISISVNNDVREEVWICYEQEGKGQASIIGLQEYSFVNIKTITLFPCKATCLCSVKDTVWVCSSAGDLYIFEASTHKHLFDRTLIIPGQEGEQENEISSIVYCAELGTVIISTFSGLLLCFEDQPSKTEEWDCTNFRDRTQCLLPVKDAVRLTKNVSSLLVIPKSYDSFQLWCGCVEKYIAVIDVRDNLFNDAKYIALTVSKFATYRPGSYVHTMAHIATAKTNTVWSLLNPDGVLDCWNAETLVVDSSLNFDFYKQTEAPITSMLAYAEFLYIGVITGTIYIFDTRKCAIKATLMGHDRQVYSMVQISGIVQPGYWVPRILGKTNSKPKLLSDYERGSRFSRAHRDRPLIMSIGSGFVDISMKECDPYSPEVLSKDTYMLCWLGEYPQ